MISSRKVQLVCLAAVFALFGRRTSVRAIELAVEGNVTAAIIVPADALPVETYAASELRYHIQAASGAQLPIVSEGHALPPGVHVYLGRCKAAAAAKLDPSALPGNGYVVKHPEASVDDVIDEYCSAFGPARGAVKEYFDYWESVYPQYPAAERAARIKAKAKYGAGEEGPYYLLAGEIFTPTVMEEGWKILNMARAQTAGDALATQRVEWLAKGLTHADLILAAENGFERAIDTGDKTEFTKAHQALTDVRAQNAEYEKANFAGLNGSERVWSRVGG